MIMAKISKCSYTIKTIGTHEDEYVLRKNKKDGKTLKQ